MVWYFSGSSNNLHSCNAERSSNLTNNSLPMSRLFNVLIEWTWLLYLQQNKYYTLIVGIFLNLVRINFYRGWYLTEYSWPSCVTWQCYIISLLTSWSIVTSPCLYIHLPLDFVSRRTSKGVSDSLLTQCKTTLFN